MNFLCSIGTFCNISDDAALNSDIQNRLDEVTLEMNTMRLEEKQKYSVAVITRTKSREFLLKRVAEKLLAQSFRDFVWVVVNDGGSEQDVNAVVDFYRSRRMPAIVLHNGISVGMEAAANLGIQASHSKYILIHDDDDTLEREFLEKTTQFLESTEARSVTVNITEIHETVTNKSTNISWVRPWDTGMPSLARMVCINRFVPISFLYERTLHDEVGYYDESLKVCGDWEFYLRLLRISDIEKIPEYLANYHIRDSSDDEFAINSVKKEFDHQRHDMLVRNRLLRAELSDGKASIASLVTVGAQLWDAERKLWGIEQKGREAFELKDRILGRLRKNWFLKRVFR